MDTSKSRGRRIIAVDDAELAHGLLTMFSSSVENRVFHPIERTRMQEVVHAGEPMGRVQGL
jgi:hypothetical protein